MLVRTDAAGGHHASAAHLPERPPPARTTQSPEHRVATAGRGPLAQHVRQKENAGPPSLMPRWPVLLVQHHNTGTRDASLHQALPSPSPRYRPHHAVIEDHDTPFDVPAEWSIGTACQNPAAHTSGTAAVLLEEVDLLGTQLVDEPSLGQHDVIVGQDVVLGHVVK